MKIFWNGIKKGFFWIFASFNAKNDGGSSARKWTAFALVICIFKLHKYHVTKDNASTFLLYDLIAIALLLGIVTAQQLLSAKFGNGSDSKREDKTINQT